MPTLGPETLDLIFRLGCLTSAQLRTLLPVPRSLSQIQRITKTLRAGGFLETVRRPYPYARPPQPTRQATLVPYQGPPSGTMSLGRPAGSSAPSGSPTATQTPWAAIHYLKQAGLSQVARNRDLYPAVAKSLYDRVLDEARVYHALLRNEFYSWLVTELAEARGEGASSVEIETLCAESGYTPMRLADGRKNKARYLNPDGVLELGDARDPAFYKRILVESDTGSQDMPWQISAKAEKFAEYLLGQLDQHRPGRPFTVPLLLFVSPGVSRTRWVRETFVENAANPDSKFAEARTELKSLGENSMDVADAILFTNFAWLHKRTTLGNAYWALSSNELVALTPAGKAIHSRK